MSRLGAHLPQEQGNSFILDTRKVCKRIILDDLLNVQIGACPALCDAGLVGTTGRGLLRVTLGHGCVVLVGRGITLVWAGRAEGRAVEPAC